MNDQAQQAGAKAGASSSNDVALPRVVANDFPLPAGPSIVEGLVELLPWRVALKGGEDRVDGMLSFGHALIDGEMMDRLPGLRVISNCGVGVDHIDLRAAGERNIRVGNTPGVLDEAVADMAFTLLLASARRLIEGDRFARSNMFTHVDHNRMLGVDVHDATLGVIGMGNIGAAIARRARGFNMTVLYHNRRRREATERELGAQYASLDELLNMADFIVLTVPLTNETRGLIDAAAITKMKRTATLINIARGPVVDTAALTDALRDGRLRAAALDVTNPEPLPRDHPLLSMDNVTLTPHLGSAAAQTRRRMAELSVANLMAGLRGEAMPHEVKA